MTSMRAYLLLAGLAVLAWAMRRAAGRLAPKVMIGTLFFLVSRVPVLLGWAVGTAGVGFMIYSSIVANGRDPQENLVMLAGISALCGLGFSAAVVGPVFFVIRALTPAPVLPLEPGEALIREVLGNHFLKGESRGGKVLVTTRRLAFRPHRFNAQLTTWAVRLEEIGSISIEGERFLLVKVGTSTEWIVANRPGELAELIRGLAALPEERRGRASAASA